MSVNKLAMSLILFSMCLVLFCNVEVGPAAAQTALPFSDNFQSSTLNPAWQLLPGQGSYTVGGGHLRYYSDGPDAATTGWYYPALTLALPFTGTNWTIETKATYSLVWNICESYTGPPAPLQNGCSSGAQGPEVLVSFSSGTTTSVDGGPNYAGSDVAFLQRIIDPWYGADTLSAFYGAASSANVLTPADATIENNIADGTYWYRITRNGGTLTISVSSDGANYTLALSTTLSNPTGTYNKLLLGGTTFSTAGSYTDYSYVHITGNGTSPGVPVAEGIGATWIQVFSPFSGDGNGDSYTTYQYATAKGGPWTTACANGIPGDSDWRRCAISGLNPATSYYVRATFYDPDGVAGTNPQVIGPITTRAVSNNFATIGQATAKIEDTNILVTIPVSDDANINSTGAVSVAAGPNGPWTQQSCGSMAFIGPKQCRVHGLTNGANYYMQVNISDADGVEGTTPQVIGPIHYTGLTDLALGMPVTADPGWGCCSDPNQLTDGVVEPPFWNYGFAWTGGTADWGGGTPGIKQATIDLHTAQSVSRLDWWIQNTQSVPVTWSVSVSNDDFNFTQVFQNSKPKCRTATEDLDIGWSQPSCKLSASFSTVAARYVRVSFDDTTLFGGMHEWANQIEVFGSAGIAPVTPEVTVTPSSASITPAQALTVAISVSGDTGAATPTGSVTLSSGSYRSAATTLSSGIAAIIIPAGSLALGSNKLTVSYSPDSSSSSTYNAASGSNFVIVTTATPVITWPPLTAITYGTALGSGQLGATASFSGVAVAGTFVYSVAGIGTVKAGTVLLAAATPYALTANFTPSNKDYTAPPVSTNTLTVNPATPTITWPTPASIFTTTPLSAAQLDASARWRVNGSSVTVAGTYTYSYVCPSGSGAATIGSLLPAGSCTLSVTFTPVDTFDYTAASGSVKITVIVPTAASPVFSPIAGTYGAAQLVSLTDVSPGAAIYYAVGKSPTTTSPIYTVPILVNVNETIYAMAVAPGYANSTVASAAYKIIGSPSALAAPPTGIKTPTATLSAIVNTNGLAGSYVFQYGTSSTELTMTTPSTSLAASLTALTVNGQISGLTSGTTYYYQVVVTTEGGTSSGAILSFTAN